MFGCIIAGRLIQTNLQQVEVNKFVFELTDAATINHIVVFLLGTIAFEPGYAATVHFLWPGPDGASTWKLLGMLSNEKPSAIFRLRGTIIPGSGSSSTNLNSPKFLTGGNTSMDMNDMSDTTPQVTATLGISIEPIALVESQMANLPTHVKTDSMLTPDNIGQAAANILKNLYNYVTSFATSSPPMGMQLIGQNINMYQSYIPLKVFQDWYDGFMRKVKIDPGMVLKGDEGAP
ncbi:3356_t:CDS:2 [Ambispora leptoticha]|uniref:3356_t:CDS:1 n=1 Tax=Ambispora leptoticha TaxID=144679 RepID=A0A9N8YSU8_9GLOM|nr:3356_t:CDS:2 [Ambispora leptoticha]